MAKRMRFILSTIMVIVAMTAKAQVTTSSLSGKVTDPDKEAISVQQFRLYTSLPGHDMAQLQTSMVVIPFKVCGQADLTAWKSLTSVTKQ